MKAYPKYKDSGVPWLGEVPEHWESLKLRTILIPNTERNQPDLPLLSVVREKGVIKRNIKSKEENHNTIPEDLSNYKVVHSGQFAMNKMKAWQGSYGVSAFEGIVSPAYFIFDISRVSGDFFHLAMRSKSYVPFFTRASDGVRIGQWDLNQTRMKEIPFFVPTADEQQQISRYLDWQTSKINQFIRAKKKLIALLKEQKQNIINQAVTKGVNPDVEMKDSGVEWLGTIPEHWEVRRLASFGKFFKGGGFSKLDITESGLQAVLYGDIYTKYEFSIDRPVRKITEQIAQNSVEIKKNDLLFTGSGEDINDIGKCVFLNTESTTFVGGDVIVFRQKFYNSNFLSFTLNSQGAKGEKAKSSKGEIIVHTYASRLKNLFVGIPKIDEQQEIAEYIQKETALIDKTIARTEREIKLIQEYRTRLVSDVVTGKVDVRSIEIPDFEPAPADLETQEDEEAGDELIAEGIEDE